MSIPRSNPSPPSRAPKHIVIATIGSLGDLHPYMALALGLRARGHHPVIAAPARYRDWAAAAGLAFAPLPPNPPLADRKLYARILDPKKGPECLIRELLLPVVAETYSELHRIVTERGIRTDLLVSNPVTFAAPLLAEKLGIPWASTVLAPLSFFSAYDPPALPGLPAMLATGPRWLRPWWGQSLRALAKGVTRTWTRPLRDLRRQLGLAPVVADPLYASSFTI